MTAAERGLLRRMYQEGYLAGVRAHMGVRVTHTLETVPGWEKAWRRGREDGWRASAAELDRFTAELEDAAGGAEGLS